MSEQIPTFEQVVELLQGVLSGDNQKIQYATKVLKKYSKLNESVSSYVKIISQNENQGLKHLAAVLLRKNILTTFQSIDKQAQEEIKVFLLQRFMEETSSVVRNQIGYTIGQIAQVTLLKGEWNDLYKVLEQQTDRSMDLEKRKGGIILLKTILDYSGEALKDFYGSFFDFFMLSIQDPSKDIKVETLKCLVVLFDNIGYMSKEQTEKYKEIIPLMMTFLDQLVKEEEDDHVHTILDGFSYLAESKLTMLDTNFKNIIEYICSQNIILNPRLPFETKELACDLIYTVGEKHRSVFNKNIDLIQKVVETCCLIVSTKSDLLAEEAKIGESLKDCVLWLVLMLSIHLNKKKVFGILLQAVTALINSAEELQQNCGFLVLAQMSEGLQDYLIKNLSNPIMNEFVPKGLSSQSALVKGSCIKALGYFAEWLGGALVDYHQVILPEILKSFGDLDVKVQEKAMITLDVFCDSMEEEQIVSYLAELIPKMIQVPYIQNTTVLMKRASISCIASCISTAGKQFRNYIPQVYSVLHEIINSKETPETDALKSEAINAVAKVALHYSKDDQEVHNTVVQPVMEKIYGLLCNYGSSEINEGCFSFFYNLAEAQQEQFGPVFDKVIEVTLKSAASNEGIEYVKDKQQGGDFSLDSDSDDDDINATSAKVKQGFLDEKSAAIHALGEFAVAVPMKFQNYFEKSLEVLDQVFDHFHDNVRLQAIICYRDLCLGMVKCANGGQLPEAQKGLVPTQRYDAKLEEILCVEVWQKLIHSVRVERENENVARNLECIATLVKQLGAAYTHPNIEDLLKLVVDTLEMNLSCQNANDDEMEEDEDTDGMVFEALTDLIPAIGATLQDGFSEGFKNIFPSMMAYMDPAKDINYRVQIVGGFCELFKEGHPVVIQIALEHLFNRLLNGVTENDDELSRNISYCLGLIVTKGKSFLNNEQIQNVLIALKHVFENAQDQACKDNSAASLCRIIQVAPEAVPVENAMDTVLSICPFQGDEEEEKVVLQTLMQLADSKGEYLQKNIEKIIGLFIDGLAKAKEYELEGEEKQQVVAFVQKLAQNYKDLVEGTVMKLAEEQKNVVINLLK